MRERRFVVAVFFFFTCAENEAEKSTKVAAARLFLKRPSTSDAM